MRKIFLQPFALKILAIITMVVDHVGLLFFPQVIWLRIIGRLSFPLFGYLLVKGINTTRNPLHYGLRLGFFAIISQFFYTLAFPNEVSLNIFFTLLITLLIIFCIKKNNLETYWKAFYVILLLITTTFVPIDYGVFGVLSIISWYSITNNYVLFIVQGIIWGLYIFSRHTFGLPLSFFDPFIVIQIFSLLAIPIVWSLKKLINSESSWIVSDITQKYIQYGFYVFYPLHLFILFLIKKSLF
jgi:hypothetical protein